MLERDLLMLAKKDVMVVVTDQGVYLGNLTEFEIYVNSGCGKVIQSRGWEIYQTLTVILMDGLGKLPEGRSYSDIRLNIAHR